MFNRLLVKQFWSLDYLSSQFILCHAIFCLTVSEILNVNFLSVSARKFYLRAKVAPEDRC